MTKKDVIELNAIFGALKDFGNTRFKYAILKNIEALKHEMAALAEVEKQVNDTITEFTNERNTLIVELGKRDDKGGMYIDPKDDEVMATFSARLGDLLTKYQDQVNAYNEKLAEFNEILKEEVDHEISFRKLSIEQCPEEGITMAQLDKLVEFDVISD